MIPPALAWLFWDVDPAVIDLDRDGDYVLERVMSRGSWEAMTWLIRRVPKAALAEFLHHKGARLTPRDRAFWSVIADVPYVAPPGGGRPAWAG